MAVTLLWLVSPACQNRPPAWETHVLEGSTMGTTFTIKVVARNIGPTTQARLQDLIERELDEVDSKMSTYRPDSELSRFNRWRETTPFTVSPETLRVFQLAQEVSELTEGAFDVTAAPLVDLWGFGPSGPRQTPPSEQEIAEARARTDYRKIRIHPETESLRKLDPRSSCDLSAIAKGYAVDRVAELLEREHLTDYMVEVGGEVRTGGLNDARAPWRIAIERPVVGERDIERIVPLSGLAMATSGGYRNFFEAGGIRYSHTIDPHTGRPISNALAAVSVVAPLCARADALATGLLVLGPDKGYDLAVRHGLAALFLVEDGGGFRERPTPTFEALQKKVE
jgi:FAD:protein FMN transferase